MTIDKKYIDQFIKVSSKAALASSYMIGKKNKDAADQAAVDSMRSELNKIDMTAQVVIGEGTLDLALPYIILIGIVYFVFKFFRK